MKLKKYLFCLYSNEKCDDSGIEALKLYLPTKDGYVNHNIVHSVMKSTNCDIWRLSAVYFCNNAFEPIRPLTRSGAEWEMALKIDGRPDFIGGYAHGDEVFQNVKLTIDGEECEITEISAPKSFNELIFEVWSVGYDPNDSITEALLHYKKFIVNESGVKVEQSVEWLEDFELGNSYMAMMPPLKCETDFYFDDNDTAIKEIPTIVSIAKTCNAKALYLLGNAGFKFGLCAVKYLSGENGENTYLVSDNGGVPYNKLYFVLQHKGFVNEGDVWKTVTRYTIEANEG